jgi:hypothetical protein
MDKFSSQHEFSIGKRVGDKKRENRKGEKVCDRTMIMLRPRPGAYVVALLTLIMQVGIMEGSWQATADTTNKTVTREGDNQYFW